MDTETFCPASRKQWRLWLTKNHGHKQAVWLVYYKKKADTAPMSWSDAVDEALCFGWIDSKRVALDEEKFMQFFSRRKTNSTWSKINKEKIRQLIETGLMTQAGYQSIETARQNGSWTMIDDVEELTVPQDMEQAFKTKPGSKDFFLSLSKSVRKALLQWIVLARRIQTRENRIHEIADRAAQKLKPKQFS